MQRLTKETFQDLRLCYCCSVREFSPRASLSGTEVKREREVSGKGEEGEATSDWKNLLQAIMLRRWGLQEGGNGKPTHLWGTKKYSTR